MACSYEDDCYELLGSASFVLSTMDDVVSSLMKQLCASCRKNATCASWASMSAIQVEPVRALLKMTTAGVWAAVIAASSTAGPIMGQLPYLMAARLGIAGHTSSSEA